MKVKDLVRLLDEYGPEEDVDVCVTTEEGFYDVRAVTVRRSVQKVTRHLLTQKVTISG